MATGRGQLWWREGDRARPHTPLQQVTLGILDFLFPWLPRLCILARPRWAREGGQPFASLCLGTHIPICFSCLPATNSHVPRGQ